ncbi:hypothetical protein T492DRAFT_849540 [Pavlovales sp. CCMP2436]|nr:hypothetical protein T492DRAFT_849540 [Pavlovales sp. CCMP2436]
MPATRGVLPQCPIPICTGKTSLIKALAHHTQRSIVNVPLSRISTNQELMDVVFDQRYSVAGEDVPIRLKFKDVVYVFEDVDAASKVVHRRDGGGPRRQETTTVTVTHDNTKEGQAGANGGEEEVGNAERNAIELALKASAVEAKAEASASSETMSGISCGGEGGRFGVFRNDVWSAQAIRHAHARHTGQARPLRYYFKLPVEQCLFSSSITKIA